MTPAADPNRADPNRVEFDPGQVELYKGHPRRWIEENLWIVNERGRLVRLEFDTNQEYYYKEIFGEKGRPLFDGTGFEAYCLKDRAARWTTFINSLVFAYIINVPGLEVPELLHEDDAAERVGRMINIFYDNLTPAWRRPKGHWDTHFKEFLHGPKRPDGSVEQLLTSSIILKTAKTRDFGRSFKSRIVVLDEMGKYLETYEQDLLTALLGSKPDDAMVFKGSTSGGPQGQFYQDYKAIKEGKRRVIYLFRPWMHRPENRLGPEHNLTLNADRGEIASSAEEKSLELDADQIRWRRRKLDDFTQLAYGDPVRGKGLFWREHPERDDYCFLPLGNPEMDLEAIQRLKSGCRVPIEDTYLPGGIRKRVWIKPTPGTECVVGYDPAVGGREGGDKLAAQVIDRRTGHHLAELYGLAPVSRFTEAVCEIAKEYNGALLVIEPNGVGQAAIEVARRIEYRYIYRKPSLKKDKVEPYGLPTTKESRSQMWHHTREDLFSGRLTTYCEDLVDELLAWGGNMEAHTPDRLSAFMMSQEVGRNIRGEAAMPVSRRHTGWERMSRQLSVSGSSGERAGFWGRR